MKPMATALGVAMLGLTATATSAPESFVRSSSSQSVFRVGAGGYCSIYSDDQLRSYDQTVASVTVLAPPDFQALLASRTNDGKCLWPAGCYYLSGSHSFFTVAGTQACRFESSQFPPGCRVIHDSLPFGENLQDQGPCPDTFVVRR